MQSVMNLKIKYRESFRPFAPSVLRERVAEYFEMDADSPYMLLVAPVVESRRTAITEEQQSLWGIDLLNVPALGHSGGHACGLLGTDSNRPRRDEPALLSAHQGL